MPTTFHSFYPYLSPVSFYADIFPLLMVVAFFQSTNNMLYTMQVGLYAKRVVQRTLHNAHFHFYKYPTSSPTSPSRPIPFIIKFLFYFKRNLLDEVFPQGNTLEPFEKTNVVEDSFFDFLFSNSPVLNNL